MMLYYTSFACLVQSSVIWRSGAANRNPRSTILSTPRMELNVVITYITNAQENRSLCTRAAAAALPDMADVGLFSLEGHLVFLDEVLLVDSVIDEIPRKVLVQPLGPVDEEIGIDLAVREGF
jgi:hypothetical protein